MPAPTAPLPLPAQLGERVLREQVASAYATIGSATVADAALALAVSAGCAWLTQRAAPLVWLLLHLAQTLRYPLLGAYAKDAGAAQPATFWARRYVREVAINSTVWGLAPWFMLPPGNTALTALFVLIVLGLCTAGMASVAPLRRAIWAYCCPMVIGLATALLWHGTAFDMTAAGCALAYLVVTLRFAGQQHRLLTTSLTARFENEALAEQLAQQVSLTQQSSDEKTRFLATASHDLRQPVHAIALFGAVLEKELHDHPQHDNAQRLMRAVQALGHSLDAMLDVSRLDAGDVTPACAVVPLNTVFNALSQTFAARADERGLQLRLRATPLWARTDPELLTRLVANLVDNALKYTPQGGVLVMARERGTEAWIDVRDTGIGIAAEHQAQVFEEFYQIDNPGRDRARGLGMGLSIVRRLSVLLDHPVLLRSLPGRGSRFRVVLPVAPPQPVDALLAQPPPRWTDTASMLLQDDALPRRVLLVDDEADIGVAMTALMRAVGVSVTHVADGAQAHAALIEARARQQPFDALICDLRLADGADGLALARTLRHQHSRTLPTLLVTGETAPTPLQRVRDSGLPVLFKPVTADALLLALARTVRAD